WALTLVARRLNRQEAGRGFILAVGSAVVLAGGGAAALLAGPWLTGLDPTGHAYDAIVWIILAWVALHAALGILMLGYCAARRAAGRMTGQYDIDITNTSLFWHFAAAMAVVAAAVVAGFPLAS